MAKQHERILELLKRFHEGTVICIDALRNDPLWNGYNEKTIRRDLGAIRESFPDTIEPISGKIGCYKAITRTLLDSFISQESLALLIQTFNIAQRSNLFQNLDIDEHDKRIIQRKINQSKKCYHFVNRPMEKTSTNTKLFQSIESAIHYQRYCVLTQDEGGTTKEYEAKPYKIVFMNENFYLACENPDDRYLFSKFRISNIKEFNMTKKSFHKNPDIEAFINEMQTPFAIYSPNYRRAFLPVIVEVDAAKAFYFKSKKHFASQKVLEERSDGTLLLEYTVTTILEIKDLIMRWLPHIKVLEPKELRDELMNELSGYLEKN